MKAGRILAPSSGILCIKKFVVKKVVSTILAALAVSFATLNTVRDVPSATYNDSDEVSAVRLGLSRQRPAFRKALSMLANAAPANQRLADYYERVTKRVQGNAAEDEDNSGAGTVIALRRSNPRAQLTVGDIAFDTNPAIEQWINYYGSTAIGRSTLKTGIDRSNEYLEMARAEFRSAGVPEDLVWLAFVESVWNPRAVSPAAAGGIWQFIPAVALEYGLKVQRGNDERADPFKQTRVAALYLRDLYTIFGDWTLAMAAYNAGEPGVMGAIIRNGNANFWEMHNKQLLPRETCNYIPKILAAIKIASQAEFYGLAPRLETPVFAAG